MIHSAEQPPKQSNFLPIAIVFAGLFLLYRISTPSNPVSHTSDQPSTNAWLEGNYGAKQNNTNATLLNVNLAQKALAEAKNPQEFEQKINELYQGQGIVSVFIQNQGNKQLVSLYIDKEPADGKPSEDEKLLDLMRTPTPNDTSSTRIDATGYGHLAGSTFSPLLYTMSGMMMASWFINRPGYSYSTPFERKENLKQHKSTFTPPSSPTKNASKPKQRSWGQKSTQKNSWNQNNRSGSTFKGLRSLRSSRQFGRRRR